ERARRRTRPIRACWVRGLSFGPFAIQRSTSARGKATVSSPCSQRNRSRRPSASLSTAYLYPQACFSAMNFSIHDARVLRKVEVDGRLFMVHLRVQRGAAQGLDIDLGVDLGRFEREVAQDPRDGLQGGPGLE